MAVERRLWDAIREVTRRAEVSPSRGVIPEHLLWRDRVRREKTPLFNRARLPLAKFAGGALAGSVHGWQIARPRSLEFGSFDLGSFLYELVVLAGSPALLLEVARLVAGNQTLLFEVLRAQSKASVR